MIKSSTQSIPEHHDRPRHIAIIMDGNGRWAKQRHLPRIMGHKRGLDNLQKCVEYCALRGVEYLTVFAFSTENWRRPPAEVSFLMGIFLESLKKRVRIMHSNDLRLRVIGERARFSKAIVAGIEEAEALTAQNRGLCLTVAADYGGRRDILQAVNRLIAEGVAQVTEDDMLRYLALGDVPEPDLFIRTGGEERISNFMLWQLAYTEFYFTQTLWPDFDEQALDDAFASFSQRERRFGRTSEQLPLNEQRP